MSRNQSYTDNVMHPLVQRQINPNTKCNGCLHYNTHKTVCSSGLMPQTCGDGSDPKIGYAPLSELAPTEPANVTTSAQADGGKDRTAHNEGFERVPTHFLGDELAEWNAMLVHARNTLVNKGEQSCIACNRGPMIGHVSPSLAGVMAQPHTCSVEVSEVFAKAMLNRVSLRARGKVQQTAGSIGAEPWQIVQKAIERELGDKLRKDMRRNGLRKPSAEEKAAIVAANAKKPQPKPTPFGQKPKTPLGLGKPLLRSETDE